MKKYLLIILLTASNFLVFSQQILFFDDFESYNSGDTVINFSNLQGWGPNGAGVAVNDPGNGAAGSDQYLLTPSGYVVTQFVTTVNPGEIYQFALNGALTGFNAAGIKFQIIQLHGSGNSDDEIRVDFTLASVGGGQQNIFKLIDTSYTAVATDTGNVAFRIVKNWGPGYKIDNYNVLCSSCSAPSPDLNILNVQIDSNQFSSCNLSSSAQITVDLKNDGNESIFGFDINYSLNNSSIVTEYFSDTINPGNSYTVPISQSLDLAWDGTYNLVLYGNTPNDTFSLNDTFSILLENYPSYNNYDHIYNCDSLVWLDGNTYFTSNNVPLIVYDDYENYNDGDDISSGLGYYSYGNGSTINASVDSGQGAYWSNGFASMDSSGFGVINWNVNVVNGEVYEFKSYMKAGSFNSSSLSLRINKGGNDIVITNHPGGNEWEELIINWTADTTGQIAFRAVKAWGTAHFDEIEINQTSLAAPQVIYSTINGCDSVITLDLTINNSSITVDSLEACDSLIWIDGITYSSSNNTASFQMNSINNCDSTIILNLNILESSSAQISDTFSFGGNYDFNGTLLDSSGTYVQIINNSVGCDSIITLDLTYISRIESQLSNKTQIYPNPSKNQVHIKSDMVIGQLFLRNIQGEILKTIFINNNELKLDISELRNGIYILEFVHKNMVWNKKIIISN